MVDRVACPWLIKKFIDRQAEFFFIPADQVISEAARKGGIPFDVPNVELGHQAKECSFEAILKKYNLTGDSALVLLGRIVNGADTDNTLYRQPEGPGRNDRQYGAQYLGRLHGHEWACPCGRGCGDDRKRRQPGNTGAAAGRHRTYRRP
jgi:hypothetical protein